MSNNPFRTQRDSIAYDMLSDYSERIPEKGQIERVQLCTVDWSDTENFKRAILPYVYIGDPDSTALDLSVYGSNVAAAVPRLRLHRLKPQEHPNVIGKGHRLYAMEADVVRADGYPHKDGFGELVFRSLSSTNLQGKAVVKVVWKSLPFRVDVPDELLAMRHLPEDNPRTVLRTALRAVLMIML